MIVQVEGNCEVRSGGGRGTLHLLEDCSPTWRSHLPKSIQLLTQNIQHAFLFMIPCCSEPTQPTHREALTFCLHARGLVSCCIHPIYHCSLPSNPSASASPLRR